MPTTTKSGKIRKKLLGPRSLRARKSNDVENPVTTISKGKTPVNADMFPDEILDLVFRRFSGLNRKALWDCIRVCRRWYNVALPYLWDEFYLASDPSGRRRKPQINLFQVLEANNSAWRHFCNTKTLRLEFSNEGFPVSTEKECVLILTEFERMQFVLHWAAPFLATLHLHLEPFIREDIEDENLWPMLEHANQIILDVATFASNTAKSRKIDLKLRIGRPHWRFFESSRTGVDLIMSILGPQLKYLHLSETSILECTRWISYTDSLKSLHLTQISQEPATYSGYPSAAIWSSFWGRLCQFPLDELFLKGTDVALLSLEGSIGTLSSIFLYDVEHAPHVCQVLLTQLPNLRTFVLNTQGKSEEIAAANKTQFKGLLASRELRTVNLQGTVAPKGLVPAITAASEHLDCFLLPKNADSTDAYALGSTRVLRLLNSVECSSLPPQYLFIINQMQLERLRWFTCPWTQLSWLTRDNLFRLAKGCPCLKEIEFQVKDNRWSEKVVISEARKALPGTTHYKHWLKPIMKVIDGYGNHHISFNLEGVRDQPGYKQFIRFKRYEKPAQMVDETESQ